jgi:hypothetical protein
VNLRLRLAALALLALAPAGCVTFEQAPVASLGCDPDLIGRWQPDGEPGQPAPGTATISATADGGCRLDAVARDGSLETRMFRTFVLDDARYAAAQAGDALEVTDADGRVRDTWPASRVVLHRYRLDGDRLLLWRTDVDAAAKTTAPGVIVRTNASRTAPGKDGSVVERPATDLYITGDRDALAALLRRQGDRLYAGLAIQAAGTMHRRHDGAAP